MAYVGGLLVGHPEFAGGVPTCNLAVDDVGGAGKDSACTAGAFTGVEIAQGVGVLHVEGSGLTCGAYLIDIVGIVGVESVIVASGGVAAGAECGGVDGGIVAKGLPVGLIVADEVVVAVSEGAYLAGLVVGGLELLAQFGLLLVGKGCGSAFPGGGDSLAQSLHIVGKVEAGLLISGHGGYGCLILGAEGHEAGIGLVELFHYLGGHCLDIPYVDSELDGLGIGSPNVEGALVIGAAVMGGGHGIDVGVAVRLDGELALAYGFEHLGGGGLEGGGYLGGVGAGAFVDIGGVEGGLHEPVAVAVGIEMVDLVEVVGVEGLPVDKVALIVHGIGELKVVVDVGWGVASVISGAVARGYDIVVALDDWVGLLEGFGCSLESLAELSQFCAGGTACGLPGALEGGKVGLDIVGAVEAWVRAQGEVGGGDGAVGVDGVLQFLVGVVAVADGIEEPAHALIPGFHADIVVLMAELVVVGLVSHHGVAHGQHIA